MMKTKRQLNEEAISHQFKTSQLSPKQRIDALDARLGTGQDASRKRYRLNCLLSK
jgi:hypothetical protein